MVQAAGAIFSGVVTAVVPHPASPGSGQSIATVSITFRVERSIRAAIPGTDVTISQWMGAWSGGQRYRIGERALLFLYPAGKLGLTSCVGGAMGRFRIDPAGRVLLSAQQLTAFHADPVLRGKSQVTFRDFSSAVDRASQGDE
jgi:hypothetical protein